MTGSRVLESFGVYEDGAETCRMIIVEHSPAARFSDIERLADRAMKRSMSKLSGGVVRARSETWTIYAVDGIERCATAYAYAYDEGTAQRHAAAACPPAVAGAAS